MYYYLTIVYNQHNLFNGKTCRKVERYRLTWDGVQYMLNRPFYREHGATFALSIYHGQPCDN